MADADLLAGSRPEADAAVAPVVLHEDVTERDAPQQRSGSPVVKHAKAVRARLARVHEQIVQRPRAQPHILPAQHIAPLQRTAYINRRLDGEHKICSGMGSGSVERCSSSSDSGCDQCSDGIRTLIARQLAQA